MGKARVTPKENFLKLRHGGMPEYVPFYSLMGDPYKGENPCTGAMIQMFEAAEPREDGRFTDIWGVPYAAPENLAAVMPDTSVVTLEDISQWTKVIKWPKVKDVDLEKVYQDTLTRVDRSQTALKVGPELMPFQVLVAWLGFEGGLMALAEDPH